MSSESPKEPYNTEATIIKPTNTEASIESTGNISNSQPTTTDKKPIKKYRYWWKNLIILFFIFNIYLYGVGLDDMQIPGYSIAFLFMAVPLALALVALNAITYAHNLSAERYNLGLSDDEAKKSKVAENARIILTTGKIEIALIISGAALKLPLEWLLSGSHEHLLNTLFLYYFLITVSIPSLMFFVLIPTLISAKQEKQFTSQVKKSIWLFVLVIIALHGFMTLNQHI